MDPSQLRQIAQRKCQDILFCVELSDDNSEAWVGSSDANVYCVDLTSESMARVPMGGDGHASYVTGVCRYGNVMITSGYDKHLVWWDTDSRESVRKIVAHNKWIRSVAFTPDGSRIISIADDMRVRVWEASTADLIGDVSDHAVMTQQNYPSMLYALDVSPDGELFATADRVGHIAVWETESLKKIQQFDAPKMYTWDPKQRRHSTGGIRSLAFSPDGKRLAAGGIGHVGNIDHLGGPSRIEIFDLESGSQVLEIEDNKKQGLVEQIAWQKDGEWILAVGGANNGFLSVFHAGDGKLIHQVDHPGHVHAMWHDEDFLNLHIAAHENMTHWTMREQEV
ncbi:MAG: hypothetical protein KDB00_20845 [Planctomycetales bacterium]|nr:hypothetical protein [Planctomycetales bacterium]